MFDLAVVQLLGVFLGPAGSGGWQNTDSVSVTGEILAIQQQLNAGVSTGDTTAWFRFVDRNCIAILEDGERQSYEQLVQSIRPLPDGYAGHVDILNPVVTLLGEIAVLNYVADEYLDLFGQKLHTTYQSMSVFSRSGAMWKLRCMQIFETPRNPVAIAVPDTILRAYAGTYWLGDSVTYTVSVMEGALFGERSGRKREQLNAETFSVFFTARSPRSRKIFTTDAQGNLVLIDRRNGSDLVWRRVRCR